MDIPALSMSMSMSEVQTAWGFKMLENSMDLVKEQGAALSGMIESVPETSVTPHLGGSIDIRGTCRGMVHAGAYGDTQAFVIADHLMPTQIRIADLIARSPDHMEKSDRAERASIKDGQIVIEPIER